MLRPLRLPALVSIVSGLACAQAAGQADRVRLELQAGGLELRATWQPLTDTVYGFEKKFALVRELAPAAERAAYGVERFRALLPAQPVAVGDTWRIDVEDVLPFLRQFHAGATADLHHDGGSGVSAPGAWACLRLCDADFAELRFRVHADFLIAGDGSRGKSSWFTPAQFRGRLLIDRRRAAVAAFELAVPQQSANVDVNIADGGGVICDIGRVPAMALSGGDWPALPAAAPQLGEVEVDELLAKKFYPLAAIDWLDLPAARAASLATGKPLHVVALFGSLLDESC